MKLAPIELVPRFEKIQKEFRAMLRKDVKPIKPTPRRYISGFLKRWFEARNG